MVFQKGLGNQRQNMYVDALRNSEGPLILQPWMLQWGPPPDIQGRDPQHDRGGSCTTCCLSLQERGQVECRWGYAKTSP